MEEQIKMFIAGEEVVSNNDFTINEEMLSASSTILNNCYPKSWELTKDYVSNFYYPKDYSKFVLGKGEFVYGNDEFKVLEKSSYKNLMTVDANSTTINGLTFTVNADKSITVSGTFQSYTAFDITDNYYYIKPSTQYTLSGGVSSRNRLRLTEYNIAHTQLSFYEAPYGNNYGYTFTSTFIAYYYKASIIITEPFSKPITFYPQLQYGDKATDYSRAVEYPYYETNVEKIWNGFNIFGNLYQKTTNGNQLVDFNNVVEAHASYTFTNDELTITATGGTYNLVRYNITDIVKNNAGKKIRFGFSSVDLSGFTSSNNTVVQLQITRSGTTTYYTLASKSGDTLSLAAYTIPDDASTTITSVNARFYANNSSTDNSTSITKITKPLVYLDSNSTYEEYTGAIPSPNPNYPQEIVGVGYENLVDFDSGSGSLNGIDYTYSDGEVMLNGTASASFTLSIPIKNIPQNTAVSISANNSVANSGIQLRLRNSVSGSVSSSNQLSTINSKKENLVTGKDYDQFQIRIQSGTELNYFTFKPQLEKGINCHSFINYGKYGIEIVNIGKNLFGSNLEQGTINGTTGIPSSATNRVRTIDFININSSTNYTLNIKTTKTKTIQCYIFEYKKDETYIQRQPSSWGNTPITFTTSANTKKLKVVFAYSDSSTTNVSDFYEMQLEIGNTATTFENYISNIQVYSLNAPLRKINDIKDRLYIQSGNLMVERNIGSVKLTDITWSTYGHNVPNYHRYSSTTIPNIKYVSSNLVTGNGVAEKYIITNGKGMSDKTNMIAIDVSQVSVSAEASPTGEFIYELATPEIENLGKVNLPIAYEGMNNTYFYAYLDFDKDIYYYWKNYDVLFAGVVKNSGDISLNPRHPHYCSLQILDYKTFLSESDTLDFVITGKTIKEAIEMVISAISGYGFITGNINISQADEMIGAYSTLNKTAYDVLQYLAEISGSRWRARYVDSSTMAIDFFDPDLLPQANNIEYSKQYWEDNNIVDLTFNFGTRDYRNKQVLLSNEVYAGIQYTELLLSNGYSTNFLVQNNIGIIVSITVGGSQVEVTTQEEKELGVDADFYYTPGKNILESANSYTAGTQIVVNYIPLVKGRQIVYNDEEVTRIATQTNTTGIIARYENRNDVLSSNELEQIAETYIQYKGKPEIILTLTTKDNDLFNVGEKTYFNSPIEDLAQEYMVKTKSIEYIIVGNQRDLFYTYELTSSFNSEKAINYFDNQRNKASGNIAEGESITRNIDINNQATIIWNNPTVNEITVTVTGDNVLNSILNSPFIE